MRISIFKINNEKWKNFMNFYEANNYKMKFIIIITILYILKGIISPAPGDYLLSLQAKYLLHGIDNLYDYTLPMIGVLLIFFVFLPDYTQKRWELISFYNAAKFNYIMFFRWCYFVGMLSLSSFITAAYYYRHVSFLDFQSLLLALRFIPNILFLASLLLLVIVLTKNCYSALFITTIYFLADFLSSARIFKWFSLGVHSNNFYYSNSPTYYLINRLLLIVLSVLFVYIACKKSAKVN